MNGFQGIRDFMREMVESGKISGCAAAVYRRGECLFREFVGYGDAKKTMPLGKDSVFRLASMTKPVTAAAALVCRQRGLLRLDAPLCEYLPEFSRMFLARKTENGFERGEAAKTPVTLLHLLTHSSGLGSGPAGDFQYSSVKPREGDTLASTVNRYAGVWLDFEPGSAQMYSPVLGLDTVARVVEIVSGEPYGDFVQKNIFAPLHMDHTSYRLEDFEKKNIVLSCACHDGVLEDFETLHNFDDFPAGYTGGGAGLLSTLDDYSKFAEMLRRGTAGGGEILTKESVGLMKKPWLDDTIEGMCDIFNWGLGVRALRAQSEAQPLSKGSFGWSGAYGPHFWVDPEKQVSAVYMHNSLTYGGAGAPHTLCFEKEVMKALEK